MQYIQYENKYNIYIYILNAQVKNNLFTSTFFNDNFRSNKYF